MDLRTFSSDTDARRQWKDIKVQKKKTLERRILYAVKLSFKYEGRVRFPLCPVPESAAKGEKEPRGKGLERKEGRIIFR